MADPVLRRFSSFAACLFSLLLAVVLLGAGISDAQAQLVGAFGFNEGTGTTTVNQAGGNNGTLTNTSWSTAGRVGNALSFNGTSARVNVADANALDLTTGMTLEAWVFPTSLTGTRTVIAKERSGGFAYGLFASNGASRPSAAIRVGTTTLSVAGPASLPLNAWSHLAATYNGSALVLYVNGTQVASQPATGTIVTTTLALRIGGNTQVTGQYFAGRIDEVRIYRQAVSAAQVQSDMSAAVDLVAPTITARSPAPGATGVAGNTTVTVTFSEAMAASSISGSTFRLTDATAAPVPATVAYNSTTRVATLTPSAPLAGGASYTATVAGGTGGVTDVSGNPLAVPAVWSFTTRGSTSTAVTSSVNPSVFGQGVTFTATVSPVSPATGTPTGTVQFRVGATNLGNPVALSAGVATSAVASTLAVGNQTITAIYSGDTNFSGSTSPALTQTVSLAGTATTVTASSANPSVFGQVVTFAATVTPVAPGGGTPTGSVQFRDGATLLGTAALSAGSANFTTTAALGVGARSITANYVGNTSFNASTSAAFAQTVNKAGTTTAVTSSANPSSTGQSVTFTATVAPVAPGGGTPAGTVQFQVDGANVGSPVTLSGGSATSPVSAPLSAGNHAVTALYSGSVSHEASTAPILTQAVSSGGSNPIVLENALPGSPPSEWDIVGAGDSSIQGFATDISVNRGETVFFKISAAASYRLDIYRLGYYGGNGARKVAEIPSLAAQAQPACRGDGTTGDGATRLLDCGNWAVSASWAVPAGAMSGIYIAKATRLDTGGASHIVFIVRDDTSTSDILFQTSDTTWQAYNSYGGSFIEFPDYGYPTNRAFKGSYNRPFATRAQEGGLGSFNWLFHAEYPMVRWLEANGYDVTYSTGVDSDRRGNLIRNHKVFLSVGHDEYWSGPQRANVEAARDAGVHLAFFSGNEVYRKIRWETSIVDGVPHRTMVCYKESNAEVKIDPAANLWTGSWRDARPVNPEGPKPENALTGTLFGVVAASADPVGVSLNVPEPEGKLRFWRNTAVANLAAGQSANLGTRIVGYEFDEDIDNGFRPAGLFQLSSTTVPAAAMVTGSNMFRGQDVYPSGTATHVATLYRAASGALVFSAGTVQWSWGLDGVHDNGPTTPNQSIRQATTNLLADMGAQPATLQPGLVAATASTDVAAPVSTISSPVSGATVAANSTITISGTATDSGGGLVGGVEVSVDGGNTWRRATGRGTWSYAWTVSGTAESVTIRSRAVDDSGNLESPSAGTTITVSGATPGGACCSVWSNATTPSVLSDPDTAAVELGVKFRSNVAGFITAIRFYKSLENIGPHVVNLWTGTGARLATAPVTAGSAGGWQEVPLASPVAIAANTTYVASYHTASGRYSADSNYFTTSLTVGPLTLLANGQEGGNGVYAYGPGGFPNQSYNASNYWVDVVFTTSGIADTTPPLVSVVTPANGAIGVSTSAAVTATFNETVDPATINSATFLLRDALGNAVPATVSHDAVTLKATLRPLAPLATSGTYTATLRGGSADPRVKDLAGNALAADFVWSFTTGSLSSGGCCSVWDDSAIPRVLSDPDAVPIEVGVKFRSTVPGSIAAIRFYKSSENVGPHVVRLWTASGALLASAPAPGGSPAGWQEVPLPAPVAITANTTYVASYHTESGHYSIDSGYFLNNVTSGPLTLLANGLEGGNGVYAYGSGGFPSQSVGASNYWVDIVFTTTATVDTTPPSVTSVGPRNGAVGTNPAGVVTATFSEGMDPASVTTSTFLLRDGAGNTVPATVAYEPGALRATLTPTAPLAFTATYLATVRGGATEPRVKDLAGNAPEADFAWSFTTGGPPPAPPTGGPGGPVLVITAASNPFTVYYAEILRTEGLNLFAVEDINNVTAATLAAHDVAILGETPLTPAQVQMLSDWVTGGGRLIAMRPDKQLAGLLGIADANSTLAEGYLLINTTQLPGNGLVGETIQFHGTADRYALNGATTVATLYTSATTPADAPAVTMRAVGTNGGQAAAFTYDLARSVVYTRQGNPAWSGQERDGVDPIRSDDLFFGAAAADLQPDWVDLSKVAIPHADEQQRLLANLILSMNQDRRPLPRFWYFPRGVPAVVVMTGDDHSNGGTAPRFDAFRAASPAGCVLENWECVRGTSYLYPGTPISDGQAAAYADQGFEIALHVNTGCTNFTAAELQGYYASQLAAWGTQFPSLPAPATNRTHCIAWSDYSTQPQVALSHGIRLDTNYYYWPPAWVSNRPGFFTGSGMPMRFATPNGSMIDVYQATTQMTDESGQVYPFTMDTLLDRAAGPEGYYGAFTANMHLDNNPSSYADADAIVASAKARGIPVVSARQMLQWLDGRNNSAFSGIAWNGTTLSFNVAPGFGAVGLRVMVPVPGGSGVSSATGNGVPVPYTVAAVKGITYAMFAASGGAYEVAFTTDTTRPSVTSVSPQAGATNVDSGTSVTAAFSEAVNPATIGTATFELRNAANALVPATVSYSGLTQTATLVPASPLDPGTAYTATVKAGVTDPAGNSMASDFSWTFSTMERPGVSLWSPTTAPANLDSFDSNAVELGIKFRSDASGSVTAIRFYKGPSDNGNHVVKLWSGDGTLLASAASTGETASGWQEVALPSPVAIAANTVYVASYHTTAGRYPYSSAYFASAGVDNGTLHAPASPLVGGNGVYLYGSGGFPNNTYNATNYWVDVVFRP